MYTARGQWMSLGKKIRVTDRDGKEVGFLHRKLGTLRPQYLIEIPGLPEFTVVRELVFLRIQYSIHIMDWTVRGDVFHHDFSRSAGWIREIARIRKKCVAMADQYSVEVMDGRDDLTVLMIVLAEETARHSGSPAGHKDLRRGGLERKTVTDRQICGTMKTEQFITRAGDRMREHILEVQNVFLVLLPNPLRMRSAG